jgi:multiple sugar transport system permease protein
LPRSQTRISNLLWYTFASALAVLFLIPLYYSVINALNGLVSTPVLTMPKTLHPENFVEAIIRIPFWRYFKSSTIIVGISVFFAVWINFILGYAFARMKAPGKDIWFSILISLMMVPGFATSIPTYVLFSKLHITDSYLIWILNGIGGSPFYTFLFRQFMQTIPKELEEAATIDGCTTIGIMFRIFLPLTVPVIAVVFMFEFLNSWGDFVTPFMFLNEAHYPLAAALTGVRYTLPNNAAIVLVPLQLAAALLFMIPSVMVYFAGQKYIKEGMITSGLKG